MIYSLLPSNLTKGRTPSVEVLHSEILSDPSSTLVGLPGMNIYYIDRVAVSPDGNRWIATMHVYSTSNPLDAFEVVVVDGAMVAAEGSTPAYLPAGAELLRFEQKVGILDSGAFVFSGKMDLNPSWRQIILAGDPMGDISLVAQQGTQIQGAPLGWLEGELGGPVLTQVGVGYETDLIDGGPPVDMDNLIMQNNSILAQTGVTVPAGQMTATAFSWDIFQPDDYIVSSDSSNYLLKGSLGGLLLNDDVLVKNGVVVLQENFPIPGGPADLIDNKGIAGISLAGNGDWMAYGDFDVTEYGWAVHNGVVVAQEMQPIHAGSSELFDDRFFVVTCNTLGDFVVGGVSNVGPANDEVLVFNGERVLVRKGDPVDLDGNGLFDDDLFYKSFAEDGAVLTDGRQLYFTGTLVNGVGLLRGDVLVAMDIREGAGVPFCDPASNNSTGSPTVLAGSFGSGVGSGLHLEATQGPPTQLGYFLVGTWSAEPGSPLGQGNLCLAIGGGQSVGRYNIVGGSLNSVGFFNPQGVLRNSVGTSSVLTGFDVPSSVPFSGSPMIVAGETWHFQLWHREAGGQSNLSNGLSVTF